MVLFFQRYTYIHFLIRFRSRHDVISNLFTLSLSLSLPLAQCNASTMEFSFNILHGSKAVVKMFLLLSYIEMNTCFFSAFLLVCALIFLRIFSLCVSVCLSSCSFCCSILSHSLSLSLSLRFLRCVYVTLWLEIAENAR